MEILNTFMAHKRNPKQIHGAQITLPRTLPLYFNLVVQFDAIRPELFRTTFVGINQCVGLKLAEIT